MDNLSDFSKSIDAAARTISHSRTLDETLQTIVEVARTSIPGFDQIGISTIRKDGKVVTRAHQGDLVLRLDDIQYGLAEGPCVETLRGSLVVTAPSLRHDQRWPRWVPEAVNLGVQSQMAVQLYLDDEGTMGGLNLYSTISPDVTQDAEATAQMFATHASIALGHVKEREGLNEALQTRKVIGQAVGILMERYEMSEDRAFAFLVRASSHGNIKLRTIAQELVDERNAE